jgi:regulator of chromosome condensation
MVSAHRSLPNLRSQHLLNNHLLNKSFLSSIVRELNGNKQPGHAVDTTDLTDLCNEYLDYAKAIKSKYQPPEATTVLTFGTGDCGQLGFGIDENRDLEVKRPRTLMALNTAIALAAGGLHNVAVMRDGSVFSWGCNDDGGVGRDTSNAAVEAGATPDYMPSKVLFDGVDEVVGLEVAAGDCQSVLVDVVGNVYAWGSYKDKEGKPFKDGADSKSVRGKNVKPYEVRTGLDVDRGVKAVAAACGASFNAIRTSDGKCLTWGLGECGELGRAVSPIKDGEDYVLDVVRAQHLTPKEPVFSSGIPSEIKVGRFVKCIGAGGYHLLAVTVSSNSGFQTWATGLNNYGQLGLGDHENRYELTPIPYFEGMNVSVVDGGMHHSVALSGDGDLYSFGRGDSGQLGNTDTQPNTGYCEESPVNIDINCDGKLVQLCCGANHNMVVSNKNEVYSWGYGDMSALGHGKDEDSYRPKLIQFKEDNRGKIIHKIAAGGQHSAMILGGKI